MHYAVIDLLRIWANSHCYELFLEAFEFLTHFCAGNNENQQALFVDVDFFLSFLQQEEGIKKPTGMGGSGNIFAQNVTSTTQHAFLRRAVPGLCIEIFRNNRAICSQITEYPFSFDYFIFFVILLHFFGPLPTVSLRTLLLLCFLPLLPYFFSFSFHIILSLQ